jgi:cation:H+ antiporter
MSFFNNFNPETIIWFKFVFFFISIVVLGWKLSVYADNLADARGWNKGVVGFVILGFATSLPELISTLSAILYIGNDSLGTGNILGSENANLFILFLSLLTANSLRKQNREIDISNIASMSMFFLSIAIFMTGISFNGKPLILGHSLFGILIITFFILSLFVLKSSSQKEEKKEIHKMSLFFYSKFLLSLILLVIVSFQTAIVVDELAKMHSWNSTAVGALFLAWATSLPELVVTISAMILGSAEMGVGNIVGSNIFNMMILGIGDFFAGEKSKIFIKDDKVNLLIALLILMSSTLLYMLSVKKLKKIFGISPIAAIISLIYIVFMFIVF